MVYTLNAYPLNPRCNLILQTKNLQGHPTSCWLAVNILHKMLIKSVMTGFGWLRKVEDSISAFERILRSRFKDLWPRQ